MASTRLLIRTTELDDRVLAFADDLHRASGHPVSFIADERRGPIDHRRRDVIGLTEAAFEAIGVHCPADFAWKCGDYGYYLARRRHPDVEHWWMIEYDVRFAGGDLAEFFAFFDAQRSADLVAPHLLPADADWFWTRTLRSRDARPYRCLFPVTRLTARAIDAALAKRVEHSGNRFRRLIWPNDEAFVATTLVHAGLECRDFNSFGRTFYTSETFTFTEPIDGDAFDPHPDGIHMYHPVLYGEAYTRKLVRLHAPQFVMSPFSRQVRRIARIVNTLSRW